MAMKINLSMFTLEISDEGVEAWATEYGFDPKKLQEIRADIIVLLTTHLQSSYEAELTGWDVNVRQSKKS